MKTIALVNRNLKNLERFTSEFKTFYFDENDWIKKFKLLLERKNKEKIIIFDSNGFLPFLYFSKQKNICCSYPLDKDIARLSIEHNNASIMVLPLDFIKKSEIKQYINNFLFSSFEGGRHNKRLEIMKKPWSVSNKTTKFIKNKKIVIACDHAAVDLKKIVISYLLSIGYDVIDVGTDSTESTAYSLYAIALGLCANWAMCGIGICGSGIGISNTINKFKGLNCCICNNPKAAKIARNKFGCNVLALGARFIKPEVACKTIYEFLNTKLKQKESCIDKFGFKYDKSKFNRIKIDKSIKVPFLLK